MATEQESLEVERMAYLEEIEKKLLENTPPEILELMRKQANLLPFSKEVTDAIKQELEYFVHNIKKKLALNGSYETENSSILGREENAKKIGRWLANNGLDTEVGQKITCSVDEKNRDEIETLVEDLKRSDRAKWIGNEKIFFSIIGECSPEELDRLKDLGCRPDLWYQTTVKLPEQSDKKS